MASQLLWWLGTGLALTLLIRGTWSGWHRRCPVFFGYLGWVAVTSLAGCFVFRMAGPIYPVYYWFCHLVGVVLGFAVLCELCGQILETFPGVRRLALLVLAAFFVALISKTIMNVAGVSDDWYRVTTVEVTRHFRFAQALLLVILVGILFYYRIPLERGIRGIFLGYGAYVGVSLIGLSVRAYGGATLHAYWRFAQQVAYIAVLCVWLAAVWRRRPQDRTVQSGCEPYTTAYLRTVRRLSEMRSSVLWNR